MRNVKSKILTVRTQPGQILVEEGCVYSYSTGGTYGQRSFIGRVVYLMIYSRVRSVTHLRLNTGCGSGKNNACGGVPMNETVRQFKRMWRRRGGPLISLIACLCLVCGAGKEVSLENLRENMVKKQIEARGVSDGRVLAAMRSVERHRFVPDQHITAAYEDHPLPIGYGQTISQPYIVALMSELMRLDGGEKVLEIGTGSGYQAAVLSLLVKEVYTIEIVEPLGKASAMRLKNLGYRNVTVRVGDGYRGWPEKAPFDAIMLTASPPRIPQ